MKGRVYTIGEALIDFIPTQKGKSLKDVLEFERVPGGAPANVAATIAKLGGKSFFISKLGTDAFGDTILEVLNKLGVNTNNVVRTNDANTGLAFVSLTECGEREFSFYRNPSADMLLSEEEVNNIKFNKNDILHFCSVDLIDCPIKKAHKNLIDKIYKIGGIISFDPNVRLNLWKNLEECRQTIRDFIPKAHILKISSDELEFITEIKDNVLALKSLFIGNVRIIIYTHGEKGARFITKRRLIKKETNISPVPKIKSVTVPGFKVNVYDTTGAGDSFIGAFLYKLWENQFNIDDVCNLTEDKIKNILNFSNACGALTTTKKGAISALPSKDEIYELMETRKRNKF